MRVVIKKTEEEIRKDLFGPLNEAASSNYSLGLISAIWCELSELRLMQLICDHKPAGVNRNFHLFALHDYMHHIYDSEIAQSEIFLSDEHKIQFRKQQVILSTSMPMETSIRVSYPPKYLCRPTVADIKRKIEEFYDMKIVEKNEGYPDKFDVVSDFFLPDGAYSELMRKKEERAGSVASSTTSKKRRIPTPED